MRAGRSLPLGRLRAIKKDPKLGKEYDKVTANRHGVTQNMIKGIRQELGIMSWGELSAMKRMKGIEDICDAHDDGAIDLTAHTTGEINRILSKDYTVSQVKEARKICDVTYLNKTGDTQKQLKPYGGICDLMNGWAR